MLASELKVGQWIKSTVCMQGHKLAPSVVIGVHLNESTPFVRVKELFGSYPGHDIIPEQEVELCQSS